MANITWQVTGDYFESCSCDYLCPCVTSNLTVPGTKGHCDFALVFHVDRGRHGTLSLDDLSFVIVGHAPERMDKGNWKVALIADERATPQQREALVAIGSGQAGGPMAGLAPLIGTFLGVEAKPIRFEKKGMSTLGRRSGRARRGYRGRRQRRQSGRAALHRQHPPSRQCPPRVSEGSAQPSASVRHQLGR